MSTRKEDIDQQSAYHYLRDLCVNPDDQVTYRTTKKIASAWLLENKSIIRNATVRYLAFKDLGLGVVEFGLRPVGKVNSYTVKSMLER